MHLGGLSIESWTMKVSMDRFGVCEPSYEISRRKMKLYLEYTVQLVLPSLPARSEEAAKN
jgi:hypothetical protein